MARGSSLSQLNHRGRLGWPISSCKNRQTPIRLPAACDARFSGTDLERQAWVGVRQNGSRRLVNRTFSGMRGSLCCVVAIAAQSKKLEENSRVPPVGVLAILATAPLPDSDRAAGLLSCSDGRGRYTAVNTHQMAMVKQITAVITTQVGRLVAA